MDKQYPKNHQGEKYEEVTCASETQRSFCVPLVFQQELVPGPAGSFVPLSRTARNTDNIHGIIKLKFNKNTTRVGYKLYVYNATNISNRITGAHIHAGAANQNGPIIASLFDGPARKSDGRLSEGVITNADTQLVSAPTPNNYSFNSVASIYEGIRRALVYVNIHSEEFPDGVIRGQVFAGQQKREGEY